jgi:Tfp pilus assembly ATPase PilU
MSHFSLPSFPFDRHELSIFCVCSFCHRHRQQHILRKVAVYITDLESLEWPAAIAPLETPPESITTYAPGTRGSRK